MSLFVDGQFRSHFYPCMQEPRHIVSLSGGKDSTALAVFMKKQYPDLAVEYVFCDTGEELKETYAYLEKVETFLGQKIIRLRAEKSWQQFLEQYSGYLPSPRNRWCTVQLKIKPFEKFVGDSPVISYIGIRADEDELERYRLGIQILTDACVGIDAALSKERPVPGKWSMLECLCHIADFEPILAYRMKSMLAFDNPELVGIDETQYGKALYYQERHLETELAVFVSTRQQMLSILEQAKPADFARTGRHTELGLISIWTYLLAASGHIEHHMQFMNEKRVAFGLQIVPCPESRDYPARGTSN